MLNEYFSNNEVLKVIKEIKTNNKYFSKSTNNLSNSFVYISEEVALYIFYDALFKFKIIIDDNNLLIEYISGIEKLYKKVDNFEDIKYGINKLICKMLINKYEMKDINSISKETIINHIYDKYISNGYFIHGFNSIYLQDIKNKGFYPEKYENYYDRFKRVDEIFEKYGQMPVLDKDFSLNDIYFTDDFIMSCYYSIYAPLFYYKLLYSEILYGNRIRKDNYLLSDCDTLTRHLKRFMNNNSFSEDDKKYILDLVKDQWNLIHRTKNYITLLVVKRSVVFNKEVKKEEYLRDNRDIYEIVDRMLSPKYNNLEYNKYLSTDDFEIIKLDNYYDIEEEKKEEIKVEENTVNNKYGSISILLVVGCLLMSLGVIISVLSILGR